MYVVTVRFKVFPHYLQEFFLAMHQQASDSLTLETQCHTFDVCQEIGNPNTIFLYEIYTTAADFQAHLASAHFQSFSKKVAPWVESKVVELFEKSDNEK